MFNNQKIETIRQACIKANPEIVELKFGCEVETLNWGKVTITQNGDDYVEYILPDGTRGDEDTQIYFEKEIQNILGRPIRLADVLLAMEGKISNDSLSLHSGGYRDFLWYQDEKIQINFWNLLKDSLSDQSEETINFLYQLLK